MGDKLKDLRDQGSARRANKPYQRTSDPDSFTSQWLTAGQLHVAKGGNRRRSRVTPPSPPPQVICKFSPLPGHSSQEGDVCVCVCKGVGGWVVERDLGGCGITKERDKSLPLPLPPAGLSTPPPDQRVRGRVSLKEAGKEKKEEVLCRSRQHGSGRGRSAGERHSAGTACCARRVRGEGGWW